MNFSLFELDWMDRENWWITVGEIETTDRQGFGFLLGRSMGRWEIDFLWLGLFNVRFTWPV
jgi:hypothetical protein